MSGDHDPQPGPAADPPKSIFGQIQDAAIQASIQPFTQRITDAQTRIRQGDSRLSELGAGVDPAYTRTDDHFEGMSHRELYEAVHGIGGLDPKGLQTMRQTWFECASELENLSSFTLMLGMNNIFGHGLWKGAAADAAQAASERYARVANQIGQVFDSVAGRMDGAAWAAEAVRKAVQPPPGSVNLTPSGENPGQALLPRLPDPKDTDQADQARERARQDAIRALNSIYTPVIPPAGANVPSYSDVSKATAGDGTSPNAGFTSNGTNPNGVQGGSIAAPDAGTGPQQAVDQPAEQSGNPSAAASPAGSNVPQGLLPGGGAGSAATTAAGVGPGGDSAVPGGGASSGLSGSDPGWLGSQHGGAGSARAPQPGFSVGGGLAAEAQSQLGTRGDTAAQGRSRTGSMPHAPHAQRKDKEEDREHLTPDFLKGVQPEWTEGLETPVGVVGADSIADFDGDEYPGFATSASAYSPPPSYIPADRTSRSSMYNDDGFAEPNPPATPRQTDRHATPPVTAWQPDSVSSSSSDQPDAQLDQTASNADAEATGGRSVAITETVRATSAFQPGPAAQHDSSPAVCPTPGGEEPEQVADDTEPVYIDLSGTGPIMDNEPGEAPPR
ncbi:hypothetical protein ACFYU5_04570 [Nocardia aobensis]|uniref:Uncharacterized protein n=1 Tax=Nocardia aobensis TaxID=257277 RepID=A0ABW6NWU0_9NOCA